MEFHLYFSIFRKTRYLIHLTICNEHILNTLDQNRNLITYIKHNFDSFFHLFQWNWQIHYYKWKIHRGKPILSILFFYVQYDIFIIWEIQYGCSQYGHILFPQIVKMSKYFPHSSIMVILIIMVTVHALDYNWGDLCIVPWVPRLLVIVVVVVKSVVILLLPTKGSSVVGTHQIRISHAL